MRVLNPGSWPPILLLLALLAVAGCGGGGLPINSGADTLSLTEQAMLDRHNNHRTGLGLAALAPNAKLNQIAQDQADFQAQHLNVGHDGEGGTRVDDRAADVGYLFLNLGENVGSAGGGIEMFNDWLASSGHRDVLEGAQYTEIGLGMAEFLGMQYWCVVFGRPQ